MFVFNVPTILSQRGVRGNLDVLDFDLQLHPGARTLGSGVMI